MQLLHKVARMRPRIPDHIELAALGQALKAFRESEAMSQEELASEVGMDRSFYGKVERGEVNISMLNFFALCRVLAVPPSLVIAVLDGLAMHAGDTIRGRRIFKKN